MNAALETTALSFTRWVCERKCASVSESACTAGCHRTWGSNLVIGASIRSAPWCARRAMPNPVKDLLVDATYQSVRSSAGTPAVTSAEPCDLA